jgi:hypothetical protein
MKKFIPINVELYLFLVIPSYFFFFLGVSSSHSFALLAIPSLIMTIFLVFNCLAWSIDRSIAMFCARNLVAALTFSPMLAVYLLTS